MVTVFAMVTSHQPTVVLFCILLLTYRVANGISNRSDLSVCLSVCLSARLSICLFPLCLLNPLTFHLDFMACMGYDRIGRGGNGN